MNIGEIYTYTNGTYITPVIVFMTPESWVEGCGYNEPQPGKIHVACLEPGVGVFENVLPADLGTVGGV